VTALQIEHLGNPNRTVSVSIGGAAILPEQGMNSPDWLVQAADVALYRAKIAGRNRVEMMSG
jgi:diguanylate cyclase (GGDEF)-like protein